MRTVLALAVVWFGLALWLRAEEPLKDSRSAVPQYHAYWLDEPKLEARGYQRLLVTTGPLWQLTDRKLGPHGAAAEPLALDHPAVMFETHGRSSLWDKPFHCLPEIKTLDAEGRSVEIEGVAYRVESCLIAVVVTLLENPMGDKQGVHRRVHPLANAERTARAFVTLLKESEAAGKK